MRRLSNRFSASQGTPAAPKSAGNQLDRRLAVGAFGALLAGEAAVALLLSPAVGACLLACTGAMGYLQYRGDHRPARPAADRPPVLAHAQPAATLPGRPELLDQAARDMARAKRYGFPLTLAVIDIPGHEQLSALWDANTKSDVGAQLAERVRHAMRASDFLAQVAPDRFVAALMDCTGEQAERFGARVTRSVGARPILTGEKNCLPVQLSAVVSSLQFAAARFGDARAFVAAAEGQPAPVSIVERVRPDGRDVRMLRRELMKDDAREPLERAS